MRSIEFQRQLRFLRQEYKLQATLYDLAQCQLQQLEFKPELIQDQRFRFLAISFRKQLRFADSLVVFLLARDKTFQISGKIQRTLVSLYGQVFINGLTRLANNNWDKLDIIEKRLNLPIDRNFISSSRIALLKIIYAKFNQQFILPYLARRYHTYWNYALAIDAFWRAFPEAEIQFALEYLLNYQLPPTSKLLSRSST